MKKRIISVFQGFTPLGTGHTWSVISLDKHGKRLYGRNKHGKRLYGRNKHGKFCRIFLPIFCDEIF
nr:hypothetical protein [Marseillevirus cajuinensis]